MPYASLFLITALFAPPLWPSERTAPFLQDVRTEFTAANGLPADPVNDVCLRRNGAVIAATAAGLAVREEDGWQVLAEPPFEPLHMAAAADAIYIAGEHSVGLYQEGAWATFPSFEERAVTCLFATPASKGLLVGTDQGLYTYTDGELVPVPSPAGAVLAIAHSKEGELALGTPDGLYTRARAATEWRAAQPENEEHRWAPRDVAAVCYDVSGRLWFGCEQGVGVRGKDGAWRLFTGQGGLPCNHVTCAAPGPSGNTVWFGTEIGAIHRGPEGFTYRFSRRWLPDGHVRGVAVEADGTAWFATAGGLSRIERREMTLDEKALYFTGQTESRHVRDGFIGPCRLKKRYDPASWTPAISDNDGMYTALYGAAQAFRWAATGDEAAKQLARRSFDACRRLVEITGTGMPARVIIPADWPEPVNEQYGEEYNRKMRARDPFWKMITPRFVESADGEHLWKCDTSSDELAGHYFLYGIYYDLCADTDEEKERVRTTVRAVTDHLIENGFLLRDHDGKPTRWGNFSPEFFHSAQGWEQRGLNSMMILSFLRVAEHITGDAKYGESYRYLCDEHHYDFNAMQSKSYFPPDFVVPWDNNLCLLSWYGLFNYETDPERLLRWRLSVKHAWQHIAKQMNPLWNLLYQACATRFADLAADGYFDSAYPELEPYREALLKEFRPEARLEDSLATLRAIPLDLIAYHVDNTHRLDVRFDPAPGAQGPLFQLRGERGWGHDTFALPIDERGQVRQGHSHFDLVTPENGGWYEHEGTIFLLAYWLGVYHGFIE